jgi:hypothetical protein
MGYEKHEVAGCGTGNSRNGKSRKTLKGEAGEMTIEAPRDRNGTFEPKLVEKHQRRFEGFDAKNSLHVCAGHDGARYSGAPARHVRGGREPVSDLRGNRQHSGRG